METAQAAPSTIDDYISGCRPEVREILEKIRGVIRKAAPDAEETISYRMPAFRLNGILLYFAAFKNHIGIYPPVRGDAELMAELAPYMGEKGNLKFPLEGPMRYDLIERIAELRVSQNRSKPAGGRKKA